MGPNNLSKAVCSNVPIISICINLCDNLVNCSVYRLIYTEFLSLLQNLFNTNEYVIFKF